MTTTASIATIMGNFFAKTHKAISEKLASEEFTSFTEEASELNNRLEAQATANALVVADLASANATIAGLNTTLSAAQGQVSALTTQLATVTGERDLFKEQHEKAASQGNTDPNEDENSRQPSKVAGYNAHALAEFQKAQA